MHYFDPFTRSFFTCWEWLPSVSFCGLLIAAPIFACNLILLPISGRIVLYSAPDRYSPFSSIQSTKDFMNLFFDTVSQLHITAQWRFARVIATFNLCSSLRNPIPFFPPWSLLLTKLSTTASRSPPWNPSTDKYHYICFSIIRSRSSLICRFVSCISQHVVSTSISVTSSNGPSSLLVVSHRVFAFSATSGRVESFLYLTDSWLISFPLYIALL